MDIHYAYILEINDIKTNTLNPLNGTYLMNTRHNILTKYRALWYFFFMVF